MRNGDDARRKICPDMGKRVPPNCNCSVGICDKKIVLTCDENVKHIVEKMLQHFFAMYDYFLMGEMITVNAHSFGNETVTSAYLV